MSIISEIAREAGDSAAEFKDLAVRVHGVSVRYRLAKEKPKTFQEYLIQRLKGKKIQYNDFQALQNVDLDISKGEALGIIGHNGAGKSTLLKVIAGVLKPSMGSVTVKGKMAPLIELGAGFDEELTGQENVYLNASILGLSRREIDAKFASILAFSELSEFIYSPLKTYSSGMVARLGFSIATDIEPNVLLVDEILSVGDEHFSKKCESRMAGFKGKGVTIIIVSHGMNDIEKLCDRVVWLDRGRIKMTGEPGTVIDEYLRISEKGIEKAEGVASE